MPKACIVSRSCFPFAGLQDLMWVFGGAPCTQPRHWPAERFLKIEKHLEEEPTSAPRESGHTAAVLWCCSPLFPAATDNLNRAVPSAFGSGLSLACFCGLWGTNKQPQAVAVPGTATQTGILQLLGRLLERAAAKNGQQSSVRGLSTYLC